MNISENLSIAINAAINAGKKIMEIYNSDAFFVQHKSDDSPLTIADKESHAIISNFLSVTDYPILSEEGSKVLFKNRKDWKLFWMIDPIDGTKEFIKKNGEFTVNIALINNNEPVLGVVYAPFLETLYFAEKKFGSYKSTKVCKESDIKWSELIDLGKSIYPKIYTCVVSKSHMNEETKNYVDSKQEEFGKISSKSFGSSLKICKVAEGEAHCYPRFGPTMEWDTAAAHAVASFAGCKIVHSTSKNTLTYNKENLLNPHFIVYK